jgi:hypothetical protein
MTTPLTPTATAVTPPFEDDARATIAAFRAFLANPAFVHRLDLAVLTKLAGDEKTPVKERRRAAEALGQLYLRAVEVMGGLLRVREHVVGPWRSEGATRARRRRRREA